MRIVLAALLATLAAMAETTVIYNGATTNLPTVRSDANDLWLTLPDLTRASGFVLKPEGASLIVVGDGKLFIDALKAQAPNLEVIPITQFDPDNASLRATP